MFPYILDDRHAPDTLFVVAESDWRLYEKDLVGSMEDIAKHVSRDVVEAMNAFMEARGGRTDDDGNADAAHERATVTNMQAPPPKRTVLENPGQAATSVQQQRAWSSVRDRDFFEHPHARDNSLSASSMAQTSSKPHGGTRSGENSDDDSHTELSQAPADTECSFASWSRNFPVFAPSEELEDVIRLVTLAHRAGEQKTGVGAGEFVWLAYNAANQKGRRQKPSHGSHCFACTRSFAAYFLQYLHTCKPDHADLILRYWLMENAERVGASYVFPSIGACESHESGCQPGLGERPTSFGKPWVADGFRGKGPPRQLFQWRKKDGPKCLCEAINFSDPSLDWRTEKPPQAWNHPDYQAELWRRWWLGWNLEWQGPRLPKKFAWAKPLNPASVRNWQYPEKDGTYGGPSDNVNESGMRHVLLVVDPNGYNRMSDGTYSSISRIAEQMVTDPPGFHDMLNSGLSKRVLRQRRAAINMYLRRFFVDPAVLQVPIFSFKFVPNILFLHET